LRATPVNGRVSLVPTTVAPGAVIVVSSTSTLTAVSEAAPTVSPTAAFSAASVDGVAAPVGVVAPPVDEVAASVGVVAPPVDGVVEVSEVGL